MTCPPVLHGTAAAEVVGVPGGRLRRVRDTAGRVCARLRQDDTAAQFARFVVVGAITTVVYALFFLGLVDVGDLNYLPAHLMATAASTALANEMHRRLTFHAEQRVNWLTAQWEAGGITVIGLLATSTALGWLDAVTDTAHPIVQVGLVATVTAVIGILRFIALRWIFRPHAPSAA